MVSIIKKFFTTSIFTLCGLLSFTYSLNANPQNPTMLKGCIVSSELSKIPKFKIYFQGTQTRSNEDGFFTIPIEPLAKKNIDRNGCSLVICKDFYPTFESINTVKSLVFSAKKPYKFFSLKKATLRSLHEKIEALKTKGSPLSMRLKLLNRQIKRHTTQYNLYLQTTTKTNKKTAQYKRQLKKLQHRKTLLTRQQKTIDDQIAIFKEKYLAFQNATAEKPIADYWFIEEQKLTPQKHKKEKVIVIPDNSVIACLNPKTVDGLESWNFPLANNFLAFPRIVLKKNLETRNVMRKQSITRSSLKSELYSFEQKVFHAAKQEAIQQDEKQENVTISLIK